MKAIALLSCLVLAGSAIAAAQNRPTFAARGDAGVVWMGSDTLRLRGPALAGEGRVGFGQIALGAGFLEGRLHAADQPAVRRDLIEARVFVAARPLPWLEMSAGPIVRAYVTDSATERWVLWQARGRVEAPIVVARLTSYVELWRAVSSRVNLALGAGRVQGGEAGVIYRPPGGRGRLAMRIAYRVDDAALSPGGGETLEAVSLAVGVGGW